MPSYLHGRTIVSSDSAHHRISSMYHDIGGRGQFTPVDTPHQRAKGQQNQHQSRPSVTPQRCMGSGHDTTGGPIPPPPGHAYDDPVLHCPRCTHPFISQVDLDRHSFVCGAVALLTGMLVPWSAQQSDQYRQAHLNSQALHGASGPYQSQYPTHNQNRRN